MGANIVEVDVYKQEGVYQIELSGEVDACSAIVLDEALDKAIKNQPQHIYINCERLTYISSAGLGALIAHLKELKDYNIKLVLYNVLPVIGQVFEIIGLDQLINLQGQMLKKDGQVQKYYNTRLPMVTNHLNS